MINQNQPNEDLPLNVRIRRYDPEKSGRSYWQTYVVPRQRARRVLDVLEFIQDELDPSLGYRRHICHNLVCRSCFVKVNGHSRMTCQAVISPTLGEITIEPLDDYEPIRDLITDFARARKK